VRLFESWEKMGASAPHSLTTGLHGERQNKLWCRLPDLLHTLQVTRSSYSVERAMEVLVKDYGGRGCYQTVRRHFLFDYKTVRGRAWYQSLRRLPDCTGATTQMTPLLFFPTPKTDHFKYYYSLITLLHSLRLRPLLLQTPTTRP